VENVADELQDLWPSTNNPCMPSGYIRTLSDSGSFWTAVQQPKITRTDESEEDRKYNTKNEVETPTAIPVVLQWPIAIE